MMPVLLFPCPAEKHDDNVVIEEGEEDTEDWPVVSSGVGGEGLFWLHKRSGAALAIADLVFARQDTALEIHCRLTSGCPRQDVRPLGVFGGHHAFPWALRSTEHPIIRPKLQAGTSTVSRLFLGKESPKREPGKSIGRCAPCWSVGREARRVLQYGAYSSW